MPDFSVVKKRDFIKAASLAGIGFMTGQPWQADGMDQGEERLILRNERGEYQLPPLPYAYNALEPYIDEETMRLHHDIHHAGYVKGLNTAVQKIEEATKSGDFAMIKHWERELAFHGAGHFLHSIFWKNMGPAQKSGSASPELKKQIIKDFGSTEQFLALFKAAANSVEGSGWAMLTYSTETDALAVVQAEKHQNQSLWISQPLMVVDVWEHAYYLKYKNKRSDYTSAFVEVINWAFVSQRYENLKKQAR